MKRLVAAALLAAAAAPCLAQELRPEPSVLYFISLPFGGDSRRDREPVVGFAWQGRHLQQRLAVDTRVMNLAGGGIEVKWLIVGAVAAGAAALAGSKDSSVATQQQQQQQAQAAVAANPPPCPQTCFALR